MKTNIILGALALGVALAGGASADTVVKGGTYIAKGTNFDGSPYSGTANIQITSETTCRITWKTGGSTSNGICMRDADSLAAAYKLGSSYGLVIYKILPNGILDGTWTIADKDGAGTEVLTPK